MKHSHSVLVEPLHDGGYRWTVRCNGETWMGEESSHFEAIKRGNEVATYVAGEEALESLAIRVEAAGRVS